MSNSDSCGRATNLTDAARRARLVGWATEVLSLVESQSSKTAERIRNAIDQFQQHRFVLTILGKAKRGKSTLVNALLSRHDDVLAPVDRLPASNVISRFTYGESLEANVYLRSASAKAVPPFTVRPEQVREYVTEEENPENRKQVECVEVRGPFEAFDRDLVLIDTPGAGSIHRYHDDVVRAVIPQSDAILFLVTARMPLDRDELELLKQVQASDVRKLFFAINRVDQSTVEELEQAEQHNRSLLLQAGVPVSKLHRISARRGFEGDWGASGLNGLVTEIRDFLAAGKANVLAERFVARVRDAASPVLSGLAAEVSLLGQSAEERERMKVELTRRQELLGTRLVAAGNHFVRTWGQAIDAMTLQLRNAQGGVEQRIVGRIDAAGLKEVDQLTQTLPGEIVDEIETVARPFAASMEVALQEACRNLDAALPDYSVGELGVAGAMPQIDAGKWKGVLTGTAAASAGGAAIAASQLAAASAFQVVTSQSLIGAALSAYLGVNIPILTTSVVPAALPAWAIIAGPVGWTLIGVGALAIPMGWTLRKSRMKDQLRQHAQEHVQRIFKFLVEGRLAMLRTSCESILEEQRARHERELSELTAALERAERSAASPDQARDLNEASARLKTLLIGEVISS